MQHHVQSAGRDSVSPGRKLWVLPNIRKYPQLHVQAQARPRDKARTRWPRNQTNTGTCAFSTASVDSSGSTSNGSSNGGSEAPQTPQRPWSERCPAGTRFLRPQVLQVGITGITLKRPWFYAAGVDADSASDTIFSNSSRSMVSRFCSSTVIRSSTPRLCDRMSFTR